MPLYYETMDLATRDLAPAHLLVKIESFSSLDKCGVDEYETKEFDAGSYKWRLRIHLKGHDDSYPGEYVSVYLAISSTQSFPQDWEVNVVFSICIFNHISGKYLFSPGKAQQFCIWERECKIPRFMSKEVLTNPSNGYVIDDICMFGAEVFVVDNKVAVTESFYPKNVMVFRHAFKISGCSILNDCWCSEEFTAGGYKWKIRFYPNGIIGILVSIHLICVGSDNNTTSCDERLRVVYTFCIKNQLASYKDHTFLDSGWFEASSVHRGKPSFLSVEEFNDANGGFIVNDTCLLEIEMSVQAVAR